MNILDLVINVAILFIMMVPGVILKKCRLCPDGFGKGISNLVLYIAQPALIVYAYLSFSGSFLDIWQNILAVFLLSVFTHVLFTAVAMPTFMKAPADRARMLRFATIFSNAAFMGIPLVKEILGSEAAIYASIYNVTFNLFLWTLGVHLCTYEEGVDMDMDGDSDMKDRLLSAVHHTKGAGGIMKVLLHPVTLASVIGIILLASGVNVSTLESINLSVITDSLDKLQALVAPLSMLVIGLRLADISFKSFLNDIYMYVFLVLRHLALPLIVVGFIKLITLWGVPVSNEAALVVTIMASTPAASSATMFAEKYNCDAAYVSRLVVVSTVLCIATMPLIVALVL